MPTKTGRYAFVAQDANALGCIQSWSATENVASERYTASCVDDGSNVPEGVTDWTVEMTGVGSPTSLVYPYGTNISQWRGVVDYLGGDTYMLIGDVLIEELTIDWDLTNGSPIGWTATGGAQGELTDDRVTAPPKPLPSTPQIATGTQMLINDVQVPELQQMSLVLRRPHTTWVDDKFIYRGAGALECDISLTINERDVVNKAAPRPYDHPNLGVVKMYVDGSLFWEIDRIRFLGKNNFTVNRPDNTVLGFQVDGQWNAVTAGTPGHIRDPQLVEVWVPNFGP